MIPKKINPNLNSLFSTFRDQLNQKHPLYILADKIDWQRFNDAFTPLYSKSKGRPAKPIRLMCGLLMLKHIRNISDESVVEQWAENSYYQYFCGGTNFNPNPPCNATDLVHFRKRIGEQGIELILKESIRVNDDDNDNRKNDTAFIDSTVQEKNITYPTDAKLHKKIIKKCQAIAKLNDIEVRQTYTRTIKKLSVDQRFRSHSKNKKKAFRADKKIKTIAGRLVRELERNLPVDSIHMKDLALFTRVLEQKRGDKNKVYSLHEPEVRCISKGKEHKKYEFGNKVSIIRTAAGLIIGAMSFRNEYDGHTIDPSLEQVERLLGRRPKILAGDRGYRGQKESGETNILIPGVALKRDSRYQKAKKRKLFCKRAGIEPTIGHLKSDHRLGRNFYKGIVGDSINVMLASAAYNFKRAMRVLLAYIILIFKGILFQTSSDCRNRLAIEG